LRGERQKDCTSYQERPLCQVDIKWTCFRLALQQAPGERLGDVLEHFGAIGCRCVEQLLSGEVDVLGDLQTREEALKYPTIASSPDWTEVLATAILEDACFFARDVDEEEILKEDAA
jgi:hypothetical protein